MRQKWIDVYRGIAVLFMTLLHFFVNIFPSRPVPFLEYSTRGVVSIGDMDLALFLFISGVSTYFSIFRVKKDNDKMITRAIIRYSKIFLLGLFLDIALILLANRVWWVLEAIGLSGIVALFFICFSTDMKLLIIFILGICYTYIASVPFMYQLISASPNGWIFGPVSLSGIVLFGYMSGEHLAKRNKEIFPFFLKAGLLLILAGFLLNSFMIYDRSIGSFSYVIISSGFSMLLVVAIYWFVETSKISSGVLEDLGKSALLVFVLNYLVLILAVRLNVNNTFSIEQAAVITFILIFLIVLVSKLYCKFIKRV